MTQYSQCMLRGCRGFDPVRHGGQRDGAPCFTRQRGPKSLDGAGAEQIATIKFTVYDGAADAAFALLRRLPNV